MNGFEAAQGFLASLGAREIVHPGGTLLAHLTRVAETLRAWGCDRDVQMAGLSHACYGTDGFGTALLELTERAKLIAVIGWRAESLVYRYGSCDRAETYPNLSDRDDVPLRDRFTGTTHTVGARDIAAFLHITAANELDVFAHQPDLAARYGPGLLGLMQRCRPYLSEPAWQACHSALSTAGLPAHP